MDAVVKSVDPGSIAEDAGIEVGDRLLSVNGEKIKDIFDYRFQTANEEVVLLMQDQNGEEYDVEIEKETYEDIGIEFENPLLDKDRGCSNQCIFCFIDQLPPNMRDTVYFKDDDTRLSFLTGNYVTLTNVGYSELERLVKYKMSPINVSVHVTDPERRCFMLGNKKAGDILEKMKFLADGGLILNAQIVLVPEVNDGEFLKKTLDDLNSLGPNIRSVSVVPVGITKYREGLHEVRPFTEEEARHVIETIDNAPRKHFVYASDEFYITGKVPIPEVEAYDGFPQLENGVGMVSLLRSEVYEYIEKHGKKLKDFICNKNKHFVNIATGVAAYDIIKELAESTALCFDNIEVKVHKIINNFFGPTITVSGLLTGGDLAEQLQGNLIGEEGNRVLLLPTNMLKSGEDVFLDDYTVGRLSEELKTPIAVNDETGADFVRKIASAGGLTDITDFYEEED